jgi:hypothetical protein
MAQVSFTISAIDKTRAAFASINQGLRSLVKGGDQTEKKFVSMGLKAVGLGSVLAVIGSQVRKVAEDVRAVPGVSEDTIRSWDQMKVRVGEVSGTLQLMVANAGTGLNSLASLIRFGWIAALDGVAAAQADVLSNEKAMAETAKISSGYYDKLTTATERLMKARLDLKHIGEGEGASITRRRQEADLLDKKAAGMNDALKQTEVQARATELRTEAERDYNKLMKEYGELTGDAVTANRKLLGSQVSVTERVHMLESALSKVNAAFNSLNGNDPEVQERRNSLVKQQIKLTDELTDAYRDQQRVAIGAANTITSGFEDAVFAGADLRDMIRGIRQDLARYIFSQTITKSVGGFLANGINSLLGGGGPTIDLGGLRAAGGPVSGGRSYIVGEQGPELFTPQGSGLITPNHAMGGGGNVYNIDARGTDESVVQRLQQALFALAGPGVVERRAIGSVSDFMKRGARA